MLLWICRLTLGACGGWLIGCALDLELAPLLGLSAICAGLSALVFKVAELIRNDLPPW